MSDQPRRILRLNMPSSQDKDAHAMAILVRAIEEKQCVQWTYNRTAMLAAPQVVYRRNDHLYCDAVVTERNGVPPTEYKLGSFRLTGMLAIKAVAKFADFWQHLDLADSRYDSIIAVRSDG